MKPTESVRVKVSKETLAELKKFADETERTVSGTIRLAIQRFLESNER